ncbi:MAG: tyrosine-type recombinase/integrase [Roseibacillus sp.]
MSRTKKRTRIVAAKSAAVNITVRPYSYEKKGVFYTSYLVQGWKEDGKWKKREFKDEQKAKTFAALKEIEIKNKGRAVRMVNTSMSDEQVSEAELAFDKLGKSYSLTDAVNFFLKNHRAPDFEIPFAEGLKVYLDECEQAGIRQRTITGKKSVLSLFARESDDPLVHEVTASTVQAFLKGLRAKDGKASATRKTWNNYRNELNHFFKWAGENDLATHRPWCFSNPVESVRIFTAKQVAEQKGPIVITSPCDVQHLLTVLLRWRGGCLAKYFALTYFAGIRPDEEMGKLAKREKELINLKTGTIHIPAEVSKTKEARQVKVSDSLAAWLKALDDKPIIPTNFDRLMKQARKHFQLSHDETRHSFISYHVALHRSVGDAALQAGNSESMVKKHYLNLRPQEEGADFFAVIPDKDIRRAVFGPIPESPTGIIHLKAV